MQVPRRFFIGCGAGLLLSFLLFFGLAYWQLGVPTESSYWSFEMNRRKLESAARISGPKLLLAGGSGTLFGLKAHQIERELGVPTVNFGTHAALGAAYILRLVQQAAKPGDTVLLAFEYELYSWGEDNKRLWAGDIYGDYLMARAPDTFRALPWRDQFELVMLMPFKRLKRGLLGKFHDPGPVHFSKFTVYDPTLVDEYGDLSGHDRARIPAGMPDTFEPSTVLTAGLSSYPAGFQAVTQFCRWAQANQVRVLATYPNLCYRPEYEAAPAAQALARITHLYATLDVPVVGTARDAMLPRSDFFNTGYHLTAEAAEVRTRRLLPRLAPYFAAPLPLN